MRKNPGIWIAAAVLLAVLVVAISVPRHSSKAPELPVSSSSQQTATPAQARPNDVPSSQDRPPEQVGVARPFEPGRIEQKVAPAVAAPEPSMPTTTAAQTQPPRPTLPVPTPAPAEPPKPSATREEGTRAIDNVMFAIRDFRAALGGNPVGNNAEITKALLGDNAKQVKLDLPDGSTVSQSGELCDPWGTPYFFHQVSAQKMEVRSAGPDREMWTGDDLEM